MQYSRPISATTGMILLVPIPALCLLVFAATAAAAPKADLWPRWIASDETSTLAIDHGPWDEILKAYVHAGPEGVNLVDYRAIKIGSKEKLDDYVRMMSSIKVSTLNAAEQRAYWINLYNALTVKLIIDHYPVKSIKDIDISPGIFKFGPWDKELISVEGVGLTLNDIEHRILRPIWKDPRVHYAVNCASIGCPNLQMEAYTAENTGELLERGAREYVNHWRGVSVEGDRLVVSSIYEWFKEDFGGTDAGVIDHLMKYADAPLRESLSKFRKISDDEYDWSLNGR